MFLYDDRRRDLDRSGDDLARALAEPACMRRGSLLGDTALLALIDRSLSE